MLNICLKQSPKVFGDPDIFDSKFARYGLIDAQQQRAASMTVVSGE
jgi:hypothetical protein